MNYAEATLTGTDFIGEKRFTIKVLGISNLKNNGDKIEIFNL